MSKENSKKDKNGDGWVEFIDQYLINKKPINANTKKGKDTILKHSFRRISKGEVATDIFPDESEKCITYDEFRDLLTDNEEYQSLYQRAAGIRLSRLQENLIKSLSGLKNKDDHDEMKALILGIKEVVKTVEATVVVNVNNLYPEDVWDNIRENVTKQKVYSQ